MLDRIGQSLNRIERKIRKSFGRGDRSTFWGRIAAYANYYIMDHAVLRVFWTNFYEVAPGIYRSNQPTPRRFRKYAAMGIRSVINLRGKENYPHYHLAVQSCEELDLDLHIAKLWARNAPKAGRILLALEKLRDVPRPLLFHCKSGADRAGFVAAMYLLVFEGASVDEARRMLSLRFVHLKWTKTGVQDYILDVYEARLAQGSIGFEEWLRFEYRGERIQNGWRDKRTAAELARELETLRREAPAQSIDDSDRRDHAGRRLKGSAKGTTGSAAPAATPPESHSE